MNEDYVFQLTEKIMVKVTEDLLLQGTLLKKCVVFIIQLTKGSLNLQLILCCRHKNLYRASLDDNVIWSNWWKSIELHELCFQKHKQQGRCWQHFLLTSRKFHSFIALYSKGRMSTGAVVSFFPKEILWGKGIMDDLSMMLHFLF